MQLTKSTPLTGFILEVEGYEWNFLRLVLPGGLGVAWYESHMLGFSLVSDEIADLLDVEFASLTAKVEV